MAVGLKDVAARAGVSIKTVSNVVHGYQYVSPETRARVARTIDELGYRPNLSARNLRGGRTGVVALALPELASPYFAEIAARVIAVAESRGWTVLIDQTDGLRDRELSVLRGIRRHLIDGVIFSPLAVGPDDLRSAARDVPLVLIGERVPAGELDELGIDHVAINNVAAAHAATTHLVDRGRRRIAAIGVQHDASAEVARLRLRGHRQALQQAGIENPSPAWRPQVKAWRRADGAAAARRLLQQKERPDAVLCFNDLLALGTLRAFAECGVRVPDDIAVAGIDDIEEGRYSTPTLTTIAPDKDAIARTSVELLAARIDGGSADQESHEAEIGFRLVVRESTTAGDGSNPDH